VHVGLAGQSSDISSWVPSGSLVDSSLQSDERTAIVRYAYNRPVVQSLWPRSAPTSGQRVVLPTANETAENPYAMWDVFEGLMELEETKLESGEGQSSRDAVIATLAGMDFGLAGSAWIEFYVPPEVRRRELQDFTRANGPSPSFSLSTSSLLVGPDDMVSQNHTHLRFPIPRGSYMAEDMVIIVWVGGQASANSEADVNPRVSFVFDPPRLYGVKNFERDPEDCEDVDRCFNTYDAETRTYTRHCRKAPAECYDTIGQFYLELVGESFGSFGSVNVIVGEWACPLAADNEIPGRVGSHSHFRLVCRAPAGYGDNLPVTVVVNGRSS